jgi:hypothetical protein
MPHGELEQPERVHDVVVIVFHRLRYRLLHAEMRGEMEHGAKAFLGQQRGQSFGLGQIAAYQVGVEHRPGEASRKVVVGQDPVSGSPQQTYHVAAMYPATRVTKTGRRAAIRSLPSRLPHADALRRHWTARYLPARRWSRP